MKAKNALFLSVFAMCVAVMASNITVQYPVQWFNLEHLLTYGAFVYPFAFLVNDLTNRRFGAVAARRVVYAGFISGLFVSLFVAPPRIAIASGLAFLFAQLMDIAVFSPLRRKTWWKAPLAAALTGSALDTILFFGIAFSAHFAFIDGLIGDADHSIIGQTSLLGFDIPIWFSLAIGDFWIKVAMAFFMLIPYGTILAIFMPKLYMSGKQN